MSPTTNQNEGTARMIINDIINNKWEECDQKIKLYGDTTPLLNYCTASVNVIKAMLQLEDCQFEIALKHLYDCQEKCKYKRINQSRYESMKRWLTFDSYFYTYATFENVTLNNFEENMNNEIMLADCKLYIAVLSIKQNKSLSALISGILELSRAWSIYEGIYKKLQSYLFSKPNSEDELNDCLSKQTTEKLLASVSFGYGIVQLGFSFMSSSLMKIANFFGFESDRRRALEALRYTSQSNDIRAPFADTALTTFTWLGFWLFGYSEVEMYLTPDEVDELINKNLQKYPESCLFNYLKAKYYQLLIKDNERALERLQITLNNAKGFYAAESLLHYEISFLNLTNLNFDQTKENFVLFSNTTNWSKQFILYVKIILSGCLNDFTKLKENLNEAEYLPVTRDQIDFYGNKRLEYLLSCRSDISKELCEFLTIELLYLWVLIPYCNSDASDIIIKVMFYFILEQMKSFLFFMPLLVPMIISIFAFFKELDCQQKEELNPIKYLILGTIYIQNKEFDQAKEMFEKVIESNDLCSITSYTQPYAYCHLCSMAIASNKINEARNYLKLAHNYGSYELQLRLEAHMRSLERQIEHKSSNPTYKTVSL